MSNDDILLASMAAQIAGGMCAYSHPKHEPNQALTEAENESIATSAVDMARCILAKVASHDDRPAALPPEGVAS